MTTVLALICAILVAFIIFASAAQDGAANDQNWDEHEAIGDNIKLAFRLFLICAALWIWSVIS